MRRNRFLLRSGVAVATIAALAGWGIPAFSAPLKQAQTESPSTPADTTPGSVVPASPNASSPAPSADQDKPLTIEEQKAAEARLVFDRALVDAAVLLTDLESYRRGKIKTAPSLSAFRSLEVRLGAIAQADPSNTQARDMANAMKMAQFQILQPSVMIAAAADRQLYAGAMSAKLQDKGIAVSVTGAEARVVRFQSPHMTRDMGRQLMDSANIREQASRLEFTTAIFTNGRRNWRFRLARSR